MKATDKGRVTIPSGMRKKHGLLPDAEVNFVDLPNGDAREKSDAR